MILPEFFGRFRARLAAKRKHKLFQKRYKAVMEMRATIAALEAESRYHDEQAKCYVSPGAYGVWHREDVIKCRRALAEKKVLLHAMLENE